MRYGRNAPVSCVSWPLSGAKSALARYSHLTRKWGHYYFFFAPPIFLAGPRITEFKYDAGGAAILLASFFFGLRTSRFDRVWPFAMVEISSCLALALVGPARLRLSHQPGFRRGASEKLHGEL